MSREKRNRDDIEREHGKRFVTSPDQATFMNAEDRIRVAFVVAEFNYDITSQMLQVARAHLKEKGGEEGPIAHVPGVFDIPGVAKHFLSKSDIDGVVAIAAVIKGETDHDALVANSAAQALMDLVVQTGKPVGLAVLGPRITKAQAQARIDNAKRAVDAVIATHRWKRAP
jgi:6,7-dimethyl-8-ribityllumazine synthase